MRYGFNELNDETKSRGYTKVNISVHSQSSEASKETTERRRLLDNFNYNTSTKKRNLPLRMQQGDLEKMKNLLPNQKAQQSKVKKSHSLKSSPIESFSSNFIGFLDCYTF
ncbi:hypothetical protein JTB14_014728 [Gonioctena quinquepunctata]|nr:hypothetical protein JTB14_014728 [Gonioctena quinquepunctata]